MARIPVPAPTPLHLVIMIACACASTACASESRERVARAPDRVAPKGESASLRVRSDDTRGVLVDVAGHVRRPGVYRLPTGGRVHEAITAAGGARAGAQLASINRAATVVDGQQVVVAGPAPGGPAGTSGTDGATAGTGMISINSASIEELDKLPGVGPVTAGRIVAARVAGGPFASIDDLDRVPGLGPATIEALRTLARA